MTRHLGDRKESSFSVTLTFDPKRGNMKLQGLVLRASFLLFTCTVSAQPNVALLNRFDAGDQEEFNDVYCTANGGYIACGETAPVEGNFHDNGRAYIVRTDGNAQAVWSRVYEEQGRSFLAYTIVETDGGDFLIGGYHGGQFCVMKIDAEGELIWREDYGTGACRAVIELKNNDYMLAGSSGGSGGRLIRINSNGDVVWSHYYEIGGSRFYSMRETADGVVATGLYITENHLGPWAIKASMEDGAPIWSHIYDQDTLNTAYSMVSTSDGGFALAGSTLSGRFYLLKINDDGERLWLNTYSDLGQYSSYAYGLARLLDGGFILVGNVNMRGGRPGTVRTNIEGRERWHQIFTFDGDNRISPAVGFSSVVVDPNDQIVICGYGWYRATLDAIIARLEPDEPHSSNITISPEDTLLTVLPGSTVDFSVTVDIVNADRLQYAWTRSDSLVGNDSLCSIEFDSLGREIVECRIVDDELVIPIRWHVTIRDFFIASHTPDSLSIALRRGSTVNFSIDSVAAVGNEAILYNWNLADENDHREDISDSSVASVEFRRLGDYSLEGYAYRGESGDGVTWNISVRSLVFDFRPEQQTLTVPLDTTITFGIIPFDATDTTIAYRWYLDGDSVGKDSSLGIKFEAWDGQDAHPTRRVTAIVSDSSDADTIVWNVTVVRPNSIVRPVFQLSAFSFSLSPNPFNARSTVHFSLPAAASGMLTLHDLTGRAVRSLAEGRFDAGEHQVALDAAELPAGLYFLRLEAGGKVKVAKAVVIK
jgi:hypothetical protein